MKNKPISTALAFVAIIGISCKREGAVNKGEMDLAMEESYQGTPVSMQYDEKIDSLIAQMTLEEKVGMLHGSSMFATAAVERLGIPEFTMADGPLGVREEISRDSWAPAGWDNDFATYYPAGGGLAATWNPEMAYRFGNSVGAEARARDKDMLLSPAINIIRTPLGGRTYEYFTEDPFLNKKMTVPFVVGVQENDVAVSVKHYAANNQETHRDYVDVQIDERTLREIYLPAFKAAVTEGQAYGFMGAYNKFRGDYLCENEYMLQTVLRDQWGFDGIVVSDWAAVHDTKKALESGTDIEMGTPKPFNEFYFADALIKAVKEGKIEERYVDRAVKRVLQVMFTIKAIDDEGRKKGELSTEKQFQDAYDIASESIVLLKNDGGLLPINLDNIKSVAVIGNNATKKNALGGFGAGVKTKREVTPLEGLKNRLPESVQINYAEGYREGYSENEKAKLGDITLNGPVTLDELDPMLVEEAVNAAKNSDVAIIFAGSNRDYETEASDRASLALPFGQEALIEKVMVANPNTIVVMIAGAPFDLEQISEKSSALVWSWFNGSEGGNALADVLLGDVNPSGKLPWTMPKKLEDSPAHAIDAFPGDSTLVYKEGILVGYRWFDTKEIEPLYPFGYGLSYTEFEFLDVQTDKATYQEDEMIKIDVNVKNIGNITGKETVQVYVSKPNSTVERANKELKGFGKAELKSGETKTISIPIPIKELGYYNVANNSWEVEKGDYHIKVGNSSRNILSNIKITIN